MPQKPVSTRLPKQVHESLEDLAEEHNLTNQQGEPSKGKALNRVVDTGLREAGYPGIHGVGKVATDGGSPLGSLFWEGGKITVAIAAGLVLAELFVDAPISLYPHAGGFLVAAVACFVLDRIAPQLYGRIPPLFQGESQ